jgi:hypothetical protein
MFRANDNQTVCQRPNCTYARHPVLDVAQARALDYSTGVTTGSVRPQIFCAARWQRIFMLQDGCGVTRWHRIQAC